MPDNRNRKRPIQVKFFIDEKEQALIKKKMAQTGIENMSAYIRKMVIDGYVVKLDMPELRELTLKMKRISNSENQIAMRVNSTGNIYEADIEEIKKNRQRFTRASKKSFPHFPKYSDVQLCRSVADFEKSLKGLGCFPKSFCKRQHR